MKNNNIQLLIAYILLCILTFGCTPKIKPTIEYMAKVDTIYQTKVETILRQRFDTITIMQDDTCELYKMSFNSLLTYYQDAQKIIETQKDSMDYLHSLNQVVNLPKKVKKNSVITVIQGNDNKSNIDKSETNQKAKDNSAIGQDNQLTKTTKKNNWWWIFLAGALSWFIVQNVLLRILKTYFPIFKFLP